MNAPAKIKMDKPGVYNLSDDDYFADPCPAPSISATDAQRMLTATPRHAWEQNRRMNPDWEPKTKKEFDIGHAAHTAMTGKGGPIHVVKYADYRTKAAKEERDEARAMGMTPLLEDQAKMVQRLVRRAREQMRAHGIGDPFDGGENEVALIWKAEGVWNRVKADCLDRENRVIYDLKTAGTLAEPENWVRKSMDQGIDLRAALYIDGAETLLGGKWTYRYIPVEKEPPHCLSVIELGDNILGIGRKKVARAREMWAHCLRENNWPGYSAEIAVVEPAGFFTEKWLNRELREEDYRQRTGNDVLAAAMNFQAPLEEDQK